MNKKLIIIGSILLVVVLVLSFLFGNDLISIFGFKKLFSPKEEKKPVVQKEEFKFEWQEWKDPAGFSFEYPKEVTINDHPEDKVNYANLELTAANQKGKIIIIAKDSVYSNIDEWLKEDSLVKDGNSLETKVASISAKRVSVGNGGEIVGLIDADGVIYTVEKQDEGGRYWQQVYNQILNTFKFTPLEGESEEDFSSWLGGFDTENVDNVEPLEVIQ